MLVGISESGHHVGQHHHRAKHTDEAVEACRKMRDSGKTYRAISAALNIPYWTVYRFCSHQRRCTLPERYVRA